VEGGGGFWGWGLGGGGARCVEERGGSSRPRTSSLEKITKFSRQNALGLKKEKRRKDADLGGQRNSTRDTVAVY